MSAIKRAVLAVLPFFIAAHVVQTQGAQRLSTYQTTKRLSDRRGVSNMADDGSKEVKSARKPPNAGKGRVKGTPNKTTALLKDAILMAATNAGGGSITNYLTTQAIENPGPFLSLLGKVLPMTVTGDKDNPVNIVHVIELVAPNVQGSD